MDYEFIDCELVVRARVGWPEYEHIDVALMSYQRGVPNGHRAPSCYSKFVGPVDLSRLCVFVASDAFLRFFGKFGAYGSCLFALSVIIIYYDLF